MDTFFFQKEKIGLQLPEYKNQTIFYCVLNWGIGHATRSIPIIQHYIALNNRIVLFSDGEAELVLKKNFPELEIYTLPSYKIEYKAKYFLLFFIALQSITRFWVIRKEKKKLKAFAKKYQPNIVISDNRYGCYLHNTENYLITHQLKLVSASWIENLSQYIIHRLTKPFHEIWIPDIATVNLSGAMISSLISQKKRWIGFPNIELEETKNQYKSELLILLSGPEPRRSQMERLYLNIIPHLKKDICFIAGNFTSEYKQYQENNLRFYSSMPYKEVLKYIRHTNIVVCRSGYSTLIDLYVLEKKNIICIPTSGQPEQEYLANYWTEKGWIQSLKESEIEKLPQLIANLEN